MNSDYRQLGELVADVDRMGALAVHVAKIARRRHPDHVLPTEVEGCFTEMGRVAVELANSAQEVLFTRDPDKAARIREQDDEMDELHRQLFTVLMDREWNTESPPLSMLALLGRFTSASPITPSSSAGGWSSRRPAHSPRARVGTY